MNSIRFKPPMRIRKPRAPVPASLSLSSWSVAGWPPTVYPGDAQRGRYLVRAHRDELLRAGALARVGRELVVIGPRYVRWLERRTADVAGYVCNVHRGETAQGGAA